MLLSAPGVHRCVSPYLVVQPIAALSLPRRLIPRRFPFMIFQLSRMGVAADNIRFGFVTMESDRHIVVRESVGGKNQLAIIDLVMNNNVQRLPVNAEAAIMNPVSKVIALRGECSVCGKTVLFDTSRGTGWAEGARAPTSYAPICDEI